MLSYIVLLHGGKTMTQNTQVQDDMPKGVSKIENKDELLNPRGEFLTGYRISFGGPETEHQIKIGKFKIDQGRHGEKRRFVVLKTKQTDMGSHQRVDTEKERFKEFSELFEYLDWNFDMKHIAERVANGLNQFEQPFEDDVEPEDLMNGFAIERQKFNEENPEELIDNETLRERVKKNHPEYWENQVVPAINGEEA